MWRLIAASVLVATIAAGAVAQSSRQSPQQNSSPGNGQQVAAPDKRGTEESPLSVKLINTGKSDKESADEGARIESDEKTQSWTIGLTIAAVLVGLLQLAAFIIQAYYMRGTVAEMRGANATARAANETAEQALLSSDRPWVGVEQFEWHTDAPSESRKQLSKIEVWIKNSGRTPALRASAIFSGALRNFSDAAPGPVVPFAAAIEHSVIFPNGELRYWPFFNWSDLSDEQLAAVSIGSLVVWITGRIEYIDAAGRRHSTVAQFRYYPDVHSFNATGESSHAD
jgi:lipoprotein signal peptidase